MREARSKIVETQDKRTVIFDKQTEADLWAIILKIRDITQNPLTEQQAESFVFCLLDEFFSHSDDIAELEDCIAETAEFLTRFAEKLKGGADNE